MSLYTIQKPCAFVVDGKGVHYRKPGVVVDLDDNTATGLGDSVSPFRQSFAAPNSEPDDSQVDDPKPRRTRKSDDG